MEDIGRVEMTSRNKTVSEGPNPHHTLNPRDTTLRIHMTSRFKPLHDTLNPKWERDYKNR